MPKSGRSRFSLDSAVDLPKEVPEPLGFSFSNRKLKIIILFLRYLQGVVESCF